MDSDEARTGAQTLVSTLADHGVTACFANPGTSEMHLVTALDGEARIRSVLCLFEGVATGAADGFARVTGQPAMTLLHLGPGYLNGGANIHNARRACSPMINVIGDHAISHQQYDAPLASDIAGLAGPNSTWMKTVCSAASAGELAAEAYAESFGPEPGPVSLILPADSAWLPAETREIARAEPKPRLGPNADRIETAAHKLAAARAPCILVNGTALTPGGLKHAARLKAAGIRVITDTFVPTQRRGAGVFAPDRMQYFAQPAIGDLEAHDLMLIAGTKPPVAFFAYPDAPSLLVPEGCETLELGGPDHDSAKLLAALADAINAPLEGAAGPEHRRPDLPKGELTPGHVADSMARHMPENALVADDGVTGSLACFLATMNAAPHDWMMLTGGSIGIGLPLAVGAAVGAPERKVVCLSGDGAGMYTNQGLWTMAREGLDVTTVVFVNHAYRILNIELYRTGAGQPGPAAKSMLNIGEPEIDWVKLSESMGVPAQACATGEAFDAAFEAAMSAKGPRLIAAIVPG